MKNNIFVKIFCTLLIAVVAAFSLSVISDEPEIITVERGEDGNVSTAENPESETESDIQTESEAYPETDTKPPVTEVEYEETTNETEYAEVVLEIVYVTETGTKYHLAGCSYLRSSAYEITIEAAEEQGYAPCSRCFE